MSKVRGVSVAGLISVLLWGSASVPVLAAAQENPFQIAFIGPTMQLVDDDEDVAGVRLNLLYGVNRNMAGLDVGLINHTNGDMTGVGFGLINLTDGVFRGWQAAPINVSRDRFTGLQWSAWTALSLANFVEEGEGAQIAWGFNQARSLQGFQLALVNVADDLYGVQVGLINIIRSKPEFWILPLVNWKFEE